MVEPFSIQALSFKCLKLASSFSAWEYIFRISRSPSSFKVMGINLKVTVAKQRQRAGFCFLGHRLILQLISPNPQRCESWSLALPYFEPWVEDRTNHRQWKMQRLRRWTDVWEDRQVTGTDDGKRKTEVASMTSQPQLQLFLRRSNNVNSQREGQNWQVDSEAITCTGQCLWAQTRRGRGLANTGHRQMRCVH